MMYTRDSSKCVGLSNFSRAINSAVIIFLRKCTQASQKKTANSTRLKNIKQFHIREFLRSIKHLSFSTSASLCADFTKK